MKRRKFLRNWPFKSQLTPADTQSAGFAKIVTFQPKLTRRQDRGITCVVGVAVLEQKRSETLWAFVKPSWWPISGPKVCISISPTRCTFFFYKLVLTSNHTDQGQIGLFGCDRNLAIVYFYIKKLAISSCESCTRGDLEILCWSA